MITKLFMFQCLIMSCILMKTMALSDKRVCLTHLFTVYIVNNLPPNSSPLVVHCASKDDDLGNHTVVRNQDYHFDFCDNFWSTTKFFCHVWWRNKDKAFVVFKEKFGRTSCLKDVCYWAVKDDGIYYSNYNPPRGLKKRYDW
ncbi:hypothetical protein CASFOL_006111 [Castilleja foliolosa]|uniref:S-protein homolog n=1 Tax=Castilleja foliolosa TaxID=1961234 RepID=A0ABD3E5F3_9LAMI